MSPTKEQVAAMPTISLVWDDGEVPRNLTQEEIERSISKIINQISDPRIKIDIVKIKPTEKGIKITTSEQKGIENLQRNDIKLKLKQHLNLTFQPSKERLAQHTLTIRPFNRTIFDFSDEQIIAGVRSSVFFTEEPNITIWKNKDVKLIKLTFNRLSHAESVKNAGFTVGSWRIPSYNIRYAQYFPILMCMRCFEFESHPTKECKIKHDICSECASTNHTYRNCPRPSPPKCVNCTKKGLNADHRTLANTCPEKRRILQRKRQEKAEEEEDKKTKEHLPMAKAVSKLIVKHSTVPAGLSTSWANAASKNLAPKKQQTSAATQPLPATAPEKNRKSKSNSLLKQILVCTINAHLHNKTYPGTYNEKLNYLLQKNEIPYTEVGNGWDSSAILEALENDLVEMEDVEEETIVRTSLSPNFALPMDTSPPLPSLDLSSVDASLVSYLQDDDSFGESETPEKEKKKNKKKKKKKTGTPTEEKLQSEHQDSTNEQPGLMVGDHQVAATCLLYNTAGLTPPERITLGKYFEEITSGHVTDPDALCPLVQGVLSHWGTAHRVPDGSESEERDMHVRHKTKTHNIKEIQEFEDTYIKNSKVRYGFRIVLQENKDRFRELVCKETLTTTERIELRELYRSCAQITIKDTETDLGFRLLLAFYRKTGLVHTLHELETICCNGKEDDWMRYQFQITRIDEERKLLQPISSDPPTPTAAIRDSGQPLGACGT